MGSILSPVIDDDDNLDEVDNDDDHTEDGGDDVVMMQTMTLRVEMKMVALDYVIDDPKESHPM